jgi:hypothetical protein
MRDDIIHTHAYSALVAAFIIWIKSRETRNLVLPKRLESVGGVDWIGCDARERR